MTRPFLVYVTLAPDGDAVRTPTDHATEAAAKVEAASIEAGGVYRGQQVLRTGIDGPGVVQTRRVCVLSTAHMTAETLKHLNETLIAGWPVVGGVLPYGFYIYIHEALDPDIAPDLAHIFTWARGRFDYIQFDCDEEPLEALPTYEH